MDGPILGVSDDVVIAQSLHELLRRTDITLAVLRVDDQIAGFSLAIPIGVMDPERAQESSQTAYVYLTTIKRSLRGKGFVKALQADLIGRLRAAGYSYVERDALLENGYADKIQRAYASAIVESYEHNRYPEVGPERFFRIDLAAVQET